jgi:hypothetical protein
VSAAGVVSLLILILIALKQSPRGGMDWAMLLRIIYILGFVTVPIGILGIGMLVDRIVRQLLLMWRRSKQRFGETADHDRLTDGGESQSADAALASRSGRRDKAVRAAVVVFVVGVIVSLVYGDSDILVGPLRGASSAVVQRSIANRAERVMTPGLPLAELVSELTAAVEGTGSRYSSLATTLSQRWHPAVALMYLQSEATHTGPWLSLVVSSDSRVVNKAREAVWRAVLNDSFIIGPGGGWELRVSGPTPEQRQAAEPQETELYPPAVEGFLLNRPQSRGGGAPGVVPLLDGYQFQRMEYELSHDAEPSSKVMAAHLGSPDGKQWYVVRVEYVLRAE